MVEYLFATEEQRELAEIAVKILEKELAPQLEKLENANDGHGQYPMDVHKKMVEAGYYAMNLGEEWGGLGFNHVTRALIYEEMSKVDIGFTFSFRGAGEKIEEILDSNIPEADKKMWVEKTMVGEAIGAMGLTEPDAGSDSARMRATAVKDGDEWVINGTKCFCTNGSIANYYIIYAWTDKTKKSSEGVTCFFVEKERGVKVDKNEYKMGIKLSPTASLVLEDVRVPEDHIIGELGKGFPRVMKHLGGTRPMVVCYQVGAAQKAVDICKEYAKIRTTFGKRLIDHQGLGFQIADMQMRVDMSRAMMYHALEAADRGMDIGRLSPGTKAMVAETCQQVAFDAIQVLGGYGYMKEYPLEKICRDCRIFSIFDGSSEIMREIVRRSMSK